MASTGAPPDKFDDCRRRRHREATDTCGFSNCAITQVSSSIVNAKSGEEQTFNGSAGAWNQRLPVPGKPMKIILLRAITVTIELNGTLARISSLL
ncbi:hypothetical protein ACNKHM_11705 [Shigella sonnei]